MNLVTDLQMFFVLTVKYSTLSGLEIVPDNRETRTSFPLFKRVNLSVLCVTCHPCITHTVYVVSNGSSIVSQWLIIGTEVELDKPTRTLGEHRLPPLPNCGKALCRNDKMHTVYIAIDGQPACDFLLVCNLHPISHRFPVIVDHVSTLRYYPNNLNKPSVVTVLNFVSWHIAVADRDMHQIWHVCRKVPLTPRPANLQCPLVVKYEMAGDQIKNG